MRVQTSEDATSLVISHYKDRECRDVAKRQYCVPLISTMQPFLFPLERSIWMGVDYARYPWENRFYMMSQIKARTAEEYRCQQPHAIFIVQIVLKSTDWHSNIKLFLHVPMSSYWNTFASVNAAGVWSQSANHHFTWSQLSVMSDRVKYTWIRSENQYSVASDRSTWLRFYAKTKCI